MNNTKNQKLLVITSYPQKGKIHGKGTVGIASYAKNNLLGILALAKKQKTKIDITVLAEKLGDNPCRYKESGINVVRIWKRNRLFSYFSLLKEIIKHPAYKSILFEFELAMFGGSLKLIPLPLFLLILRIMGKKVYFVSHQAITDINSMANHIGLKPNSFKCFILNKFISIFYRFVFAIVYRVIVFEQHLKNELARFGHKEKIVVIPHGVEKFKCRLTYNQARKQLDLKKEFVILYFGFIAWYKGADWIIDQISEIKKKFPRKKIKLIIAGGANPNHADKKFYMDYVKNIEQKSKIINDSIAVTGFVSETDISKYFIASDMVILPYRTFMSSSGPASIAYSFKKPILVSENIKGIFKNDDMKNGLKSTGLSEKDFTFNLGKKDIATRLKQLIDNSDELSQFSNYMRISRSFENISSLYLKEFV